MKAPQRAEEITRLDKKLHDLEQLALSCSVDIGSLYKRMAFIEEIAREYASTDGAHHKQYALVQILLECGVLFDGDQGIA